RQQEGRGALPFRVPLEGKRAGFDQAGRAQAVYLVLRLHQLLFEREVDFFEAGLQLRQRKDALIHHRQAERGKNGLPLLVGDGEGEGRVAARSVFGFVRRYGDVEIIGGGDDKEARLANDVLVGQDFVRVDVQRPDQIRR